MKNMFILLLVLLASGCAETHQRIDTIVDDPAAILQDPGFANYEQKLNALEKKYLQKEITYAEYLEEKKEIENNYEREVKRQEAQVDDPLHFRGPDSETFR
jgi:hypothetical protein